MKAYSVNGIEWQYGRGTGEFTRSGWSHKLLGPCPFCGTPTFNYGGGWRCNKDYCFGSVNNPIGSIGPAPDWWDTDINIGRDGNQFTAYRDGFLNLMESKCGFGDEPRKAIEDLRKQEV